MLYNLLIIIKWLINNNNNNRDIWKQALNYLKIKPKICIQEQVNSVMYCIKILGKGVMPYIMELKDSALIWGRNILQRLLHILERHFKVLAQQNRVYIRYQKVLIKWEMEGRWVFYGMDLVTF